jgi:hypothetical protein
VGATARTDEHRAVGGSVPSRSRPARPRFGVDGTLERFVRVPYALPEEQLTEAVELLARAWHSVTGSVAPEPTAVVV